ncbi:MAG TPA: hypothetical protein VG273_28235 [Bryobacteraceae bacterium]|nr:hypothetical protein [Bryobacteraceae bacterium]
MPAACAKKDFTTAGRPVFGTDGKSLLGISMKKDSFRKGEGITVNTWVANPSSRPIAFSRICMSWVDVNVYNMQGREIEPEHRKRQRERQKNGDKTVENCSSSYPVLTVEPRSCKDPDELGAADEFIDYDLQPGRYIVTPVPYPKGPKPGQGVTITIVEGDPRH